MTKRPTPLDPDEIDELRDALRDRQFWHKFRDIAYNISIWSAGVIGAVVLIREQIVSALHSIAKLLGVIP